MDIVIKIYKKISNIKILILLKRISILNKCSSFTFFSLINKR